MTGGEKEGSSFTTCNVRNKPKDESASEEEVSFTLCLSFLCELF